MLIHFFYRLTTKRYADAYCLARDLALNLEALANPFCIRDSLYSAFWIINLKPSRICFTSNSDNLVNTVGNDLHRVNEEGRIVNKHDEVSWVVHQYDRFSQELKQKISVKYDFTIWSIYFSIFYPYYFAINIEPYVNCVHDTISNDHLFFVDAMYHFQIVW